MVSLTEEISKQMSKLIDLERWLELNQKDRYTLGLPAITFLKELVRLSNYPEDLPSESKLFLRRCLIKLLLYCQKYGILEGDIEVIKEKIDLEKNNRRDKIVLVEWE